jgi:uncharacterized protein (DUF1778 family)
MNSSPLTAVAAPRFVPRVKMITVRCTEEERAAIKDAAWQAQKSVNQFCLDAIRAAIGMRLQDEITI